MPLRPPKKSSEKDFRAREHDRKLPRYKLNENIHGRPVPKLHRKSLYITADLMQRLQLVRALTGVSMREWLRWQITMAVDLELAKRPGALWLRPGSRIYRLEAQGPDFVPVPIAVSLGGERLWVIETIPDLGLAKDDPTLPPDLTGSGLVVDITAMQGDLGDQAEYRRVVVAAADALPREPFPWTGGLYCLRTMREREKKRRERQVFPPDSLENAGN